MFLTPTETRSVVINLQSSCSGADSCLEVPLRVDMFSGARRRARVPVARRESVHTRDGGVWLHAAWTMNSKPPADTTGIEWNHAGMKGWSAPTHAVTITNVEGVQ